MRAATLAMLGLSMFWPCSGTCAPVQAVTGRQPAPDLLAELRALPNDLARYQRLLASAPAAVDATSPQLLASLQDQLGLYNAALSTFPFDNRIVPPAKPPLPEPLDWRAQNAATAIAALATRDRIVLVNEAHHDGHTRELTLALLPRLYAKGYRYLAIEALGSHDPALQARGYAVDASGSQYLHEPLYGEIVRQAIRLGYTLVSYDSDAAGAAARETGQARNIYRRVFAHDAQAKLLVHAGYAHIDKAAGNLGAGVQPMAAQLGQLTGLPMLSVDQTQFRDIDPGRPDHGAYGVLVERFHPHQPVVLRRIVDGKPWSADPLRHDISVILPRAGTGRRPDWLSLGGQRQSRLVNTDLCHRHLPCMVEARYASEPDTATPADRYTFWHDDEQNALYLFPGRYRLRAVDGRGKLLDQRTLQVGTP